MVDLLECTIMPYAWGSRTAIAELTGRAAPSGGPEAELWMGAHPMAPSRLRRGGDAAAKSLADVITESPARELGGEVAATFGARLPFLLKVLAADQPLSLQAHPDAARARAGFAEEDLRGIPRDAPTRSYRDTSHKPELLCALVPVDALCGFRRAAETLDLFDELALPELGPALAALRASPDSAGLAALFRDLMTMSPEEAARIVGATIAACSRSGGRFAREKAWAVRLGALYPGDVGVVSALLLNLVRLEPGDALYLGAGNLHAYLEGVGVEIMASSDNVLRGGLTSKHVDVAELLRVLDFTDGPIDPIRARPLDAHERVWDTPAREFRLSSIELDGSAPVAREVLGPEILLCTRGAALLAPEDGGAPLRLPRGSSAFVPASTARYALRTEGAECASVYRATVNLT